jgi:hypothetical protein
MVEASMVLLRSRAALISKENTMKQHQKRFIIEVQLQGYRDDWVRSGNDGLTDFFATRKVATAALAKGDKSLGLKYRVRQK